MYKLLLLVLIISANSYAQQTEPLTGALASNKQFDFSSRLRIDDHAPAPGKSYSRSCNNGYTVTGNVLGFAGGALIGWPCGTYLGGGVPDWNLAVAGAVALAVAIPLAVMGQRKCRGRYAAELPDNSMYVRKKIQKQLIFASCGNTIGLQLNF